MSLIWMNERPKDIAKSPAEKVDDYLNRHPILESLLGITLVGLMLAALIYLAFYVPEAGR